MSHNASTDQFLELCVDPDGLFVRIDLHHKSITTSFKEWISWHVDTAQVEVASGVFHFIEPNGSLVGIKSCACEGSRSMRNLL